MCVCVCARARVCVRARARVCVCVRESWDRQKDKRDARVARVAQCNRPCNRPLVPGSAQGSVSRAAMPREEKREVRACGADDALQEEAHMCALDSLQQVLADRRE